MGEDGNQVGMIGGEIGDRDDNITVSGTAYMYHSMGTNLMMTQCLGVPMSIEDNVSRLHQFDPETRRAKSAQWRNHHHIRLSGQCDGQ